MKVNPNRENQSVAATNATRKAAKPPVAPATSDFTESAQLTQKLANAPEVRAEEVARAKALIADPNYPDNTTIQKVAQTLADKIKP